MKQRLLLISGLILVLILIIILAIYIARRKEDPEVLLNWLKKGKGDHEEILMRLNMARGEVVTPMIKAFNDKRNPDKFRSEILELMFKKNIRAPEPQFESTFKEAVKDTSRIIRKTTVTCYSLYADARIKPLLIPFIADPDTEIRRMAYSLFSTNEEVRELLNKNQRDSILELAYKQRSVETDSQLTYLNRSLIGREVADLCKDGFQAIQRTKLDIGDSLFERAISVDTNNPRAYMMLATYYASNGDKKKAEQIAHAGKCIIEIPRLPSPPKIDGDPSDPVWSKGVSFEKLYTGNQYTYRSSTGKAKLIMGHNGGKIYIALLGYEDDLDKLKITVKNDGGKVFLDDCFEIILNPGNERQKFYKFAFNAAGCVYQKFSSKSDVNFKHEKGVKIFKDRGYWSAELAVSGKELGNHPIQSGSLWNVGAIFGRVGNKNERNYFWHDFDFNIQPLALFK